MSSVKHIAFTAYPVTDLPRAIEFYEGALGLKKEGLESPVWTEFAIGDATFGVGTFEQIGKPGTAMSLGIEVDDMAAMRASLTARGIESSEPFETPMCFISGVQDPDGNTVFLHQSKNA
jgi:predicted enzyme related to lactoylglutathione lyase